MLNVNQRINNSYSTPSARVVPLHQVKVMMQNNRLSVGEEYRITGVDSALYGGTDIILTAITPNQFSIEGHGIFYNPKYNNPYAYTFVEDEQYGNYYDDVYVGYGVWQTGLTVEIGDTTIWGGKHWTNTTGDVGTVVDIFTLSADWTAIPFNANDYNVSIDPITYHFVTDAILSRKDKFGNEVSMSPQWLVECSSPDGYGFNNPIKVFQWGNGDENFSTDKYNYIGTQNNKVIDSYFECINFASAWNWNNTLTGKSFIYNNTFNGSYPFTDNTLNNESKIYNNITSEQAAIKGNTLNTGKIFSNILTNGFINDNIINFSSIRGNSLTQSSNIQNNFLTSSQNNESEIRDNTMIGSAIYENMLAANSRIKNLTMTNTVTINNNIFNTGVILNGTFSNTCYIKLNTFNGFILDLQNTAPLVGKVLTNINSSYVYITQNLSTATIIFDYQASKAIGSRLDGTVVISYINNSNVQVTTAITT